MSDLEIQAGLAGAAARRQTGRGLGTRFGTRFGGRVGLTEVLAAGFVLFLLLAAFAPGLVAPGDPLAIDPRAAFQPPRRRTGSARTNPGATSTPGSATAPGARSRSAWRRH
ncbi:hypothetical protein [Cryobacterium sp. 10C3]|uniref:hypothetical protein n=1 Tax=Cryobacterium sp. 10C3 TaxID=3048577 RepID=UPI002AB5094D|nr:hypothetical protein [Cryobacterium sp. 10C3]MDY7556237.1 hypothetical protein [Cryobacterium sp. 10C3]